MISTPDRINAVSLIDEAVAGGARRTRACKEMGINDRTYRRWTSEQEVSTDGRPSSARPTPRQKFTEEETRRVLEACHEPEHASLPPGQIVPRLADRGEYVGSVSTFYRTLHAADEQHHRGPAKPPTKRRQPTSHCATGPNQVWTWDVSYCTPGIRREQDARTGSRVCRECRWVRPGRSSRSNSSTVTKMSLSGSDRERTFRVM